MTCIQQFSLDTPTVCLGRDIICNIFYENQFLFIELWKWLLIQIMCFVTIMIWGKMTAHETLFSLILLELLSMFFLFIM